MPAANEIFLCYVLVGLVQELTLQDYDLLISVNLQTIRCARKLGTGKYSFHQVIDKCMSCFWCVCKRYCAVEGYVLTTISKKGFMSCSQPRNLDVRWFHWMLNLETLWIIRQVEKFITTTDILYWKTNSAANPC